MKTLTERLQECSELYRKLQSLGLSVSFPGMIEFYAAANDFVKTGQGASGSIKLIGLHRRLLYVLSHQPHVKSNIILKHTSAS